MTLNVKLGSFTLPNSNNSAFAVSGVGFQPKLIIFLSAWNWSWSDSASARLKMSLGAVDGFKNQYSHAVMYRDAIAADGSQGIPGDHIDSTTLTSRCIDIIGVRDFGGTPIVGSRITGSIVSIDADGFTLNVVDTIGNDLDEFPTDTVVQYLALGGQDIEAKVGRLAGLSSSSGNQSFGGVGFKPKALFFFGAGGSTGGQTTEGYHNLGAATSSSNRVSASQIYSDLTNVSYVASEALTTKAYHSMQESLATTFQDFDLVSMDQDGFTINNLVAAASANSQPPGYIALGGIASYDVGRWAGATATGVQDVSATVSPELLFLFGDGKASHSDFSVDGVQSFFGIALPGVANIGVGLACVHAASTTDCATRKDDTKSLLAVSGGTPTVAARGSVIQRLPAGFRVNWDTADATARMFNFLAIQGAPGGETLMGQVCY